MQMAKMTQTTSTAQTERTGTATRDAQTTTDKVGHKFAIMPNAVKMQTETQTPKIKTKNKLPQTPMPTTLDQMIEATTSAQPKLKQNLSILTT